MKTLGIIGGVGPDTTAKVYLSLVENIRNSNQSSYPSIIIHNLPFLFSIEKEAIVDGINSDKMIPYLIESAQILEKAGADFGILPCNTLHKYIADIRNAVHIPFLSILEETRAYLQIQNFTTVGILASETTVQSKLYDETLRSGGVTVIYPTRMEQKKINAVIIDLLRGERAPSQAQLLQSVTTSLQERGAQAALLACTDLQLATTKDMQTSIPLIDTTDILIRATLRELIQN